MTGKTNRKTWTVSQESQESQESQGSRGNQAQPRVPGRPAGGGDRVRQALLDAARQLFLNYQFKAVSVRQIAKVAGVNSAMVNYYFGGKKGLYLAMVDEVIGALEQPLQELDRHDRDSVHDFVSAYMHFLAANPWWPNFIIREVLFGADEFRRSIIGRFSQVFASRLIGAVSSEIASGNYRADLRPELATWSLMGLVVFPFLSRPIASVLLKSELDEATVELLIAHTCELFEHGVLAAGRDS